MVRRLTPVGYWVYHSHILNESGQGASDISWTITPAAGDVFEFLYGTIVNHDTAGRVLAARIDDGVGGQVIGQLANTLTVAAADEEAIPQNEASGHGPGIRYFMVNPMRLQVILVAVADAQDADFGMVARCSTVPTVVTAGAGAEVVDEITNQLM